MNQVTNKGVRATNVSEIGPARGLVAWYPLLGDTEDYAGNNHATNNGAVATPEGYKFNGVDNHLFIGNTDDTSLNGDFTLSVWCWTDADRPGAGDLLAKGSNNSYRWRIWSNRSAWLLLNDGNGYDRVMTNGPWGVSTWIHHVVTVNLNDGIVTFFNDGVVTYQGTTSKRSIGTAGSLYVGAMSPSNECFKGILRDVRIYNETLTPEEVAILHQITRPGGPLVQMSKDTLYTRGQIKEVDV